MCAHRSEICCCAEAVKVRPGFKVGRRRDVTSQEGASERESIRLARACARVQVYMQQPLRAQPVGPASAIFNFCSFFPFLLQPAFSASVHLPATSRTLSRALFWDPFVAFFTLCRSTRGKLTRDDEGVGTSLSGLWELKLEKGRLARIFSFTVLGNDEDARACSPAKFLRENYFLRMLKHASF